MAQTLNQSPKASMLLLDRANALGLEAHIIDNSSGDHRRHHPLGSTSVPQKVINIEGQPYSIGGAKQYLVARESKLYE